MAIPLPVVELTSTELSYGTALCHVDYGTHISMFTASLGSLQNMTLHCIDILFQSCVLQCVVPSERKNRRVTGNPAEI